MAVLQFALTFALVVPTTPAAAVETPPTPAEQVIRSIVSSEVSRESLEIAIRRCAARAHRPKTCDTELPIVLAEFARSGPSERAITLQAIDAASKGAVQVTARELQRLRSEIENGVARERDSRTNQWFKDLAGREGPPSRGEEGRLPQPVFKARLLAHLDRFLSTDRSARVREALEAATAETCEAMYGGKATEACNDLGLWRLQWGSLWLAVMDLRASHGEEEVVSTYLSVPRETLEAAVLKGELSTDEGLVSYMHVLRRWMERRPTRWKAWLDVEELLGPR